MDLSSLEIFEAVAAESSVTRAAALLGRVQSNVTTRLQALEQQVGTPLFLREGKRLTLTAQGVQFLHYSQRIRALANEAIQALHPGQPQGSLRIGCMESTAATRLPAVLTGFHRSWAEVALHLSTGTSQGLLTRLANAELDCALVALVDDDGATPDEQLHALGLRGVPTWSESLVLASPQDVALDQLERPSLAAFAQGCTYRNLGQRWLAENLNTPALQVQEVGSYHAMLACVAAGQSLCTVPRSLLALHSVTAAVAHELGTVTTWLTWRNGYTTAALNALQQLIADNLTEAA